MASCPQRADSLKLLERHQPANPGRMLAEGMGRDSSALPLLKYKRGAPLSEPTPPPRQRQRWQATAKSPLFYPDWSCEEAKKGTISITSVQTRHLLCKFISFVWVAESTFAQCNVGVHVKGSRQALAGDRRDLPGAASLWSVSRKGGCLCDGSLGGGAVVFCLLESYF